eukprot:5265-Heterococcus_DN1.PRE.14
MKQVSDCISSRGNSIMITNIKRKVKSICSDKELHDQIRRALIRRRADLPDVVNYEDEYIDDVIDALERYTNTKKKVHIQVDTLEEEKEMVQAAVKFILYDSNIARSFEMDNGESDEDEDEDA